MWWGLSQKLKRHSERTVWCAGGGGELHLGLVELCNLNPHTVPRLHPALGDGGGVHAIALLLLKLCRTLACLLRFGLAPLLCLLHLLLVSQSGLPCHLLSALVSNPLSILLPPLAICIWLVILRLCCHALPPQ